MSLFRFSALAVACLLAAAPVFAEELKMTDKLHRQLIDTDPAYKAADALLERSWQIMLPVKVPLNSRTYFNFNP